MCGSTINVYAGAHADALLIDSGEHKTLLVAGGAIPQGPATAADCFAKATLQLKKKPNFYEGPLNPVHNEIIDADANSVSGKRAGLYVYPASIRIGNVETAGICADGVDFFGVYKKISERDAKYASVFTKFMLLEDQNAAEMKKNGRFDEANQELRPFVEINHAKLKLGSADRKAVESIVKEYESAQGR
ncbi:hypothetical protein BTH42_13530 [Burkholderia sp. SRS-W-2-2016]|nr:hypothetical protein BTH42_13530 [Burkholderia sp. SRS-W-2-2016]